MPQKRTQNYVPPPPQDASASSEPGPPHYREFTILSLQVFSQTHDYFVSFGKRFYPILCVLHRAL